MNTLIYQLSKIELLFWSQHMRRTLMEELSLTVELGFELVYFVQKTCIYIFVGENRTEWNLSPLGAVRPRLGAARCQTKCISNRHDLVRSRIPLEHWERPVLTWERSVPTWDDPPSLAAARCQPSEFLPVHITGHIGDGPLPIGDGPLPIGDGPFPTWYIHYISNRSSH